MPDAGYDLRLDDNETASLLIDRQDRDILRPNPAAQGHAAKPDGQPAANIVPGDSRTLVDPHALQPDKAAPATSKPPVAAEDAAGPPKTPSHLTRRKPGSKSHGPFVDRQLQMAMKYLTDQLARKAK